MAINAEFIPADTDIISLEEVEKINFSLSYTNRISW